MSKRRKVDAKTAELDRSGTLNPHPEAIVDPLFQNNPFFDARDLLQTRYEMLRRHRIEGRLDRGGDTRLRRFSPRRSITHRPRSPSRVSPACYRGCAARRAGTSFPAKFSTTFSRRRPRTQISRPRSACRRFNIALVSACIVAVLERALQSKKKRRDPPSPI